MNLDLRLKIKKRNQSQIATDIIIFLPFAFALLTEFLHFPNAVKYLVDIAWLFSVVIIIKNYGRGVFQFDKKYWFVYLLPVAFFLVTLVVYTFRYQSFLYYLWGFRNNFRFYIAFFIFICFLKQEDIEDYLKKFEILFWINSAVCGFQYLVLGKTHDYLGGLFGTQKGCNGFLNVFFVFITAKSVVYFLNKRENIWLFLSKIIVVLVLSALAELKFFYLELILIIVVASLITNLSWRKVAVILSGVILVPAAIEILLKLYPHFDEFFSSFESIIASATTGGYSDVGQVNRLTTIPQISESFLTTPIRKLFGLGLGNCDTSAFAFLTTPFYEAYHFIRYNWFSTAFLYLETGFVGLTFVFAFYIIIFFCALAEKKRADRDMAFCQITAIVALCSILITLYNSSMRAECAYIIYFALAFPFIPLGNKTNEITKKQEKIYE